MIKKYIGCDKMADKKLYREKDQKQIENDNLKNEIEKIRAELNEIVIDENKEITSKEVIELSRKLDELIVKYLRDKQFEEI